MTSKGKGTILGTETLWRTHFEKGYGPMDKRMNDINSKHILNTFIVSF
jgi:hypothetical protein